MHGAAAHDGFAQASTASPVHNPRPVEMTEPKAQFSAAGQQAEYPTHHRVAAVDESATDDDYDTDDFGDDDDDDFADDDDFVDGEDDDFADDDDDDDDGDDDDFVDGEDDDFADDDDDDDDGDDDDDDDFDPQSFIGIVTTRDNQWIVTEMVDIPDSLDRVVAKVRKQRSEGPAFALLCLDDDFFIIVRPTPDGVKVLLSDATRALVDDLAADALSEIGAELPDIDDDDLDELEPWAEGDFEILADLGVSAQVMDVICADSQLWATDQLLRIADEVGFADLLAETFDLGEL
ncbi:hypothetical protein CCHOA_11240 [Corynebacterium choanae]|uniref:tRNA adenosine deaminase-associated protein n=2 Tax=Corynebacterium choanae TaxID=1862358 RepID=A0A3G6JA19_9CORY|nr:hypothetical protein CCHOA_11240 [Corynebacterium choanae]